MARYYKIIDNEKLLKANTFLAEVKTENEQNKKIVKQVIPFDNISLFGHKTDYGVYIKGFKSNIDNKGFVGFKLHKDGNFFPDKGTKRGKEISEILSTQNNKCFFDTEHALDEELTPIGRFTVPKLYVLKNKELILQCDSSIKLDKSKYEEVTFTYVEDNY